MNYGQNSNATTIAQELASALAGEGSKITVTQNGPSLTLNLAQGEASSAYRPQSLS